MKKPDGGLLGKFGRRSVFTQLMAFLLLYSAVIMCSLYIYNSHEIGLDVEHRLQMLAMGNLEKTQESIDTEIRNMKNQLVQLSHDEYIKSAMTAPNLSNHERNYNIVYQLQTVANVTGVIQDAFLYLNTDASFYSSTGAAMRASEWEQDDPVLSLMMEFSEQEKRPGTHQFFFVDSQAYLLFNAPAFYKRVLGTLAFKLNMEHLYSLAEGSEPSEDSGIIWICSEQGNPILNGYIDYPVDFETMQERYYTIVSEDTGWRYYLSTDADLLTLDSKQAFVRLLTALLILGVFCLLFSLYLTRWFYKPIRKLTKLSSSAESTAESGSSDETHDLSITSKNELELLEKNLTTTINRNQEMEVFIRQIGPSLTADIFRNILLGHEMDMQKVQAAFTTLGSGFCVDDHYAIMMIGVANCKGATDLDKSIYLHQIEQLTMDKAGVYYKCCFVHVLGYSQLVAIFGVPGEVSVSQFHNWENDLMQEIGHQFEKRTFELICCMSRYLVDISELYNNFISTKDEFQYRIYRKEQTQQEPEKTSEPALVDEMIIRRMVQIMQKHLAEGMDLAEVRNEINIQTETVLPVGCTQEMMAAFLNYWWRCVMKILVTLDLPEQNSLYQKQQELLQIRDRDTFLKQFRIFNRHLVELLSGDVKNKKKKYVDRALEYIEENYEDSTLSLSGISDFLGISQSYLSTQFKKETGVTFVEYLNRYRIEKSLLLLKLTDISVEDIGFNCGFSSSKNFIRVFKKYKDCSPGVYRDRNQPLVTD